MSSEGSNSSINDSYGATSSRAIEVSKLLNRILPKSSQLPFSPSALELLTWVADDEPILQLSPYISHRDEIALTDVIVPGRILTHRDGQIWQWLTGNAVAKSIKADGVLFESNNEIGTQELFVRALNKGHAREIAQAVAFIPRAKEPTGSGVNDIDLPEIAVTTVPNRLQAESEISKGSDSRPQTEGLPTNRFVADIERLALKYLPPEKVSDLSVADSAIIEWLGEQASILGVSIGITLGAPFLNAVVTDRELIVTATMRNRAQPYLLVDIEEVKSRKKDVIVRMKTTKNIRVVAGSSFGGHQRKHFLWCVSPEHAQELARVIQAGRTRATEIKLDIGAVIEEPESKAATGSFAGDRLRELTRLHETGLISADEYRNHRERILGEL